MRNSIYSMNFACQLIRIVYRYSLKYLQHESSSIETSPPKIVDFESNFHDPKHKSTNKNDNKNKTQWNDTYSNATNGEKKEHPKTFRIFCKLRNNSYKNA